MIRRLATLCFLALAVSAAPAIVQGRQAPAAKQTADKAAAYYHYSLGHVYAELAGAYGSRSEFLDKAIDNYREAMKADPDAGFLADELADLYIQAGRMREAVLDAKATLKDNPDDLDARRILGRIYTRLIGDTRQHRVNEDMADKAIAQYEKIVAKVPNNKSLWLLLGRLYKLRQDSVKAENAYKKVLKLDPGNEDALLGLATVYSDLGDQPRAAKALRQVVGKDPNVRSLAFLAATYEQMHDSARAAATYRRALDLAPDNTNLKRALAENLLQNGKQDEALKLLQEVAAAVPEDYRSRLRIAQIYRQKHEYEQARTALASAKKLAPDDLEVRYGEVNLLDAEGDTAKAIPVLQQILESTKKSAYSTGERANRSVFLERLAYLYRATKHYQQAVDTFTKLGKLNPGLRARMAAQIADTWRQAKEFQKAAAVIDPAYKEFPGNRMVAIVRATILADLGKFDEAIAVAKKATQGKQDRESYLAMAQIYEKTKHFGELAKVIDQAEKLSTNNQERAGVLFMRGVMYERSKHFDQAVKAFQQVLRLSPDNASAMNYLGYMYADRNIRLEEARKLITKALDYEPQNGAYLDSLGWVYYRMDKLDQAEDYLKRAIQKISRDPTVHEHLADVYFRKGNLRQAITHWRASLKEWASGSAGEKDPAEVAKIQKKIAGAEVRLAKESAPPAQKQP